MKFCKNLQEVVNMSDPEWAPYWLNYKALKKIIKELSGSDSSDDNNATTPSSPRLPRPRSQSKADLTTKPGEQTFFEHIRSEFQKCVNFFDSITREYAIRYLRLQTSWEFISSSPGALMMVDRYGSLHKAVYKFYQAILLQESYALMTYTGFSKILKKHDKVTSFDTRNAFMVNVVAKANFNNIEPLLEQIADTKALYHKISLEMKRLGEKDNMTEDEELFISMVQNMNQQASKDHQEEENTLTPEKEKEGGKKRRPGATGLTMREDAKLARR